MRAIAENDLPVETVMGISTDKACKPVNVMGMTKAIQERVYIDGNLRAPKTRFICARYGNVLASRGSVVPLFLDQIAAGGPVTITTADMTRFLLTLEDAVDTIFAAVRSAAPGETYIPQCPSAKMTDLAAYLIGDRDIETVITGIRPGEKIHEILLSEEEATRTDRRPRGLLRAAADASRARRTRSTSPRSSATTAPSDALMTPRRARALPRDQASPTSSARATWRPRVTKVLTLLGTRPEIIRLSRVIARARRDRATTCSCTPARTTTTASPACSSARWACASPTSTWACAAPASPTRSARCSPSAEELFRAEKPDTVLILGDTNTGLAAFVAKRMGIRVCHMEAGNRCFDDRVPEEVNRRVIDHSSSVLMPYTYRSAENLVREGIERQRIYVTGNPIKEVLDHYAPQIDAADPFTQFGVEPGKYFLVTAHRAEMTDDPERLASLVAALNGAVEKYGMPARRLAAPAHRRQDAGVRRGRGRGQVRAADGPLRLRAPREGGVLRALRQRHRAGGVLHLRRSRPSRCATSPSAPRPSSAAATCSPASRPSASCPPSTSRCARRAPGRRRPSTSPSNVSDVVARIVLGIA